MKRIIIQLLLTVIVSVAWIGCKQSGKHATSGNTTSKAPKTLMYETIKPEYLEKNVKELLLQHFDVIDSIKYSQNLYDICQKMEVEYSLDGDLYYVLIDIFGDVYGQAKQSSSKQHYQFGLSGRITNKCLNNPLSEMSKQFEILGDNGVDLYSKGINKRTDPLTANINKKRKEISWSDSMAVFAWGDAKFGMTEKEIRKTKAFEDKDYDMTLCKSLGLSAGMFHFYYDGKKKGLSSLKVSCVHDLDYLDNLISDIQKLYKQIKVKYGEPTGVKKSPLSLRKLDIIGVAWLDLAYWSIGSDQGKYGTKYISMSIRKYTGTLYEAFVDIHNPSFKKDYKPKSKEDIEKEEKNKKKLKEAKDNAF